MAGCGERPFPFGVAKQATALRVSHARRTGVREINDPGVLQRVLHTIDQYDRWETIPECRTSTCDDIGIEWVLRGESVASMSLCNSGSRVRVGEPRATSPCGRHVPASAAAALLKELDEQ